MSADYPLAEEHFVPRSFMFDSNAKKAIVIHKTGGDATPQAVYNTFLASGDPGKSSHFAIGTDGTIWQFVPLALGAGANGFTDATTEAFWQPYIAQYGNLNTCTISIEHCDPSPQNDTPLTPVQKQASFALVAHLCQKHNIASDHIKPHRSICSTACPGTYPMQELVDFIAQGGSMQQYTPQSTDFGAWFGEQDANHWTCNRNGHIVQFGIKAFYATLSLDGNSLPLIGLPISDEIYTTVNGAKIVLQVFERGGIWYDPTHTKGHQPGTNDCSLCSLTDPDFLAHVPGLTTPAPSMPVDTTQAIADMNAIADGVTALVAKALVTIKKL